jgi:hypothetical protein
MEPMRSATFARPGTSPGGVEAREPISPVWPLLLPDRGSSEKPIELCELGEAGPDWHPPLAGSMEAVADEGILLVTCERGGRGALLRLLNHRRWRRVRTPRISQLERALRDGGFEIVARYDVWPSARAPRVVLPGRSYPALRWVQRSGVLGGGGRRLLTRGLARSALFTPLSVLLTPGVAIVARRRKAGDEA